MTQDKIGTFLEDQSLPVSFSGGEALEEFMARPSRKLVCSLNALNGDIIILGIGGKIGPDTCPVCLTSAPVGQI